jgi:hypothetical protein
MFEAYKNSYVIRTNVNIIISSFIAIFIAAYPVNLTYYITFSNKIITICAFLIDAIIDTLIFSLLFMITSGTSLSINKRGARPISQIESQQKVGLIMTGLFFLIAMFLHYILMEAYIERTTAFIVGYLASLAICRSIHTLYGLRNGLFD